MNHREKAAAVQLKIRLKEPLWAALKRSAAERGVSMNAEAMSRLEKSFLAEQEIFGGAHTATLMSLLGLTVKMVEQSTGKKWNEDLVTHRHMRRALAGVLAVFDFPPDAVVGEEDEEAVGLRAAVEALMLAGLDKERIEKHFSSSSLLVVS